MNLQITFAAASCNAAVKGNLHSVAIIDEDIGNITADRFVKDIETGLGGLGIRRRIYDFVYADQFLIKCCEAFLYDGCQPRQVIRPGDISALDKLRRFATDQ